MHSRRLALFVGLSLLALPIAAQMPEDYGTKGYASQINHLDINA